MSTGQTRLVNEGLMDEDVLVTGYDPDEIGDGLYGGAEDFDNWGAD